MSPLDSYRARPGTLFGAWFALTGKLLRACLRSPLTTLERWLDAGKDRILDLGTDKEAEPELPGVRPLPAVCPLELAAALEDAVIRTLMEAAERINADPGGCWQGVTEEQVQALFRDLAQETLTQALELRVASEEARQEQGDSAWVKKYHRMLAAEGRWPAAEETDSSC